MQAEAPAPPAFAGPPTPMAWGSGGAPPSTAHVSGPLGPAMPAHAPPTPPAWGFGAPPSPPPGPPLASGGPMTFGAAGATPPPPAPYTPPGFGAAPGAPYAPPSLGAPPGFGAAPGAPYAPPALGPPPGFGAAPGAPYAPPSLGAPPPGAPYMPPSLPGVASYSPALPGPPSGVGLELARDPARPPLPESAIPSVPQPAEPASPAGHAPVAVLRQPTARPGPPSRDAVREAVAKGGHQSIAEATRLGLKQRSRARAHSLNVKLAAGAGVLVLAAVGWATGTIPRLLGLGRPSQSALEAPLKAALGVESTCGAQIGWRGQGRWTVERDGHVSAIAVHAAGGHMTSPGPCLERTLQQIAYPTYDAQGFVHFDIPLIISPDNRLLVDTGIVSKIHFVTPRWTAPEAPAGVDKKDLERALHGAARHAAVCFQEDGFVTEPVPKKLEVPILISVDQNGEARLQSIGQASVDAPYQNGFRFSGCLRSVVTDHVRMTLPPLEAANAVPTRLVFEADLL